MKRLTQLQLITSMNRHEAIESIRDSIASAGGWVLEEVFFSNKAVNIRFELEAEDLDRLIENLQIAGLSADILGPAPTQRTGEISGTIAATFSHDEKDLKQTIPAFG